MNKEVIVIIVMVTIVLTFMGVHIYRILNKKIKTVREYSAYPIILVKRGYSAIWEQSNPILEDGEIAYDKNVNKLKIGDGVTRWNDLAYVGE